MADTEWQPGQIWLAEAQALNSGQVWLSAEQKDLVLVALAYWRETLAPSTESMPMGVAGFAVRRIDEVARILHPKLRIKEVPDA